MNEKSPPVPSSAPIAEGGLVEDFFRHEYGRLVAVLTRKVGVRHLALIEDAVQGALMAALRTWTTRGVPDDPGAWVYRVAHNGAIDALRRYRGRRRILARAISADSAALAQADEPSFPREVADDLLRMLFVCCDDQLPPESRLVLALKTLCGFSVSEIALRLFMSEANVRKRLTRAGARLRARPPDFGTPPLETLRSRLSSVHAVLYLLFNEGYLSAHGVQAIREELCEEAVRLTTLLAEHPVGAVPETCALLALMHLHAARMQARCDADGGLLLLDEQDRARWDHDRLALGAAWLARSAAGERFTRFHAEAGIAAAHAFAPSFAQTSWHDIAELYAMLERVAPSPLHTVNRAVAVAEWQGPDAGLAVLDGLDAPAWLTCTFLWNAVAADLHLRAGHRSRAEIHMGRALDASPSDAVRQSLRRRWERWSAAAQAPERRAPRGRTLTDGGDDDLRHPRAAGTRARRAPRPASART